MPEPGSFWACWRLPGRHPSPRVGCGGQVAQLLRGGSWFNEPPQLLLGLPEQQPPRQPHGTIGLAEARQAGLRLYDGLMPQNVPCLNAEVDKMSPAAVVKASRAPGGPGELPPEAPTDPYVTLSRHTAPVTHNIAAINK